MLTNFFKNIVSNKRNIIYNIKHSFTIAFLLMAIPNDSYALVTENSMMSSIIEQMGNDAFNHVVLGGTAIVLITTVLRLIVEYTKGGSKYRFYDIVKQCIIVLVILFILPFLPNMIEKVFGKYFTSFKK